MLKGMLQKPSPRIQAVYMDFDDSDGSIKSCPDPQYVDIGGGDTMQVYIKVIQTEAG